MSRIPRPLRLALLTASASLAAAGVLLPTGALAAPAATSHLTAPAGGHRHHHDEDSGHRGTGEGTGTGPVLGDEQGTPPRPADPQPDGVIPADRCKDPKVAPGLCVDGKPLPKGDGHVVVPEGTYVPSPTGSSTVELAV
ncbi:hypothetical protein GCM10010302_45480 [Streptomyces polychromogenes]|uniref:Uncharacterized protein n=1 Tax=Streptomyces polychromogenes TaxID=67342 RepID=A0ABN0VHR8_9ACTN